MNSSAHKPTSRPYCLRVWQNGFTLIEMLICVSVIALLLALLLPSLGAAKAVARTAACSSNLRQQGVMVGQYAADTIDYIPQPVTAHAYYVTNFTWTGGGPLMEAGTSVTSAPSCPEYNAGLYQPIRTAPLGAAWFFWQGYLPPTVKQGKLGILNCPDSPYIGLYRSTWVYAQDGGAYTVYTNNLANHTVTGLASSSLVGGAGYDCQINGGYTDYYYRGWAMNSLASPTPHYSAWSPSRAFAVDREQLDTQHAANPPSSVQDPNFLDVHGDGLNIMFIDGHVTFGGKNINDTAHGYGAMPPYIYYDLKDTGLAYATIWGIGGSNGGLACSGHPNGAVSTGFAAWTDLWRYYETGEQ